MLEDGWLNCGVFAVTQDPNDADKVILLDGIDYKGHAIKALLMCPYPRPNFRMLQLGGLGHGAERQKHKQVRSE